jgi:RimJ/RimL family protein N-acetyltransferase
MPEIEIRPAVATDIKTLISLDHASESDYVWQLDVHRNTGEVDIQLREVRLPRTVSVHYPRPTQTFVDDWNKTSTLVALSSNQLVGYLRMTDQLVPGTVWITDLVIGKNFRRKGIATALIIATHQWALQRNSHRSVIEMPSKNNAAIKLAQKLGYEFCGYNDQYYVSRDVAVFFGRLI